MTDAPSTFDALIETWGIAQFAGDLGLSYSTANAMKQRKSIAAWYWPKLLDKAPKRGIRVSWNDLAAMQAKSKEERQRRSVAA